MRKISFLAYLFNRKYINYTNNGSDYIYFMILRDADYDWTTGVSNPYGEICIK